MAGWRQDVSGRVEALPDTERVALKLKAKSARDALFDAHPELVGQPYDDTVGMLALAACMDNGHDGETLIDLSGMLDHQADLCDGRAMRSEDDAAIEEARTQEEGYRALARTAAALLDEGFSFASAGSPTPAP